MMLSPSLRRPTLSFPFTFLSISRPATAPRSPTLFFSIFFLFVGSPTTAALSPHSLHFPFPVFLHKLPPISTIFLSHGFTLFLSQPAQAAPFGPASSLFFPLTFSSDRPPSPDLPHAALPLHLGLAFSPQWQPLPFSFFSKTPLQQPPRSHYSASTASNMHSPCQICAPATWKNWCLRVLTERKWLLPLPVRGYLRPLVADVAVVAKCHLSALYRHEKGKLFAQLVDLLQFYERFEINDYLAPSCSQTPVIYSERRVRRKSLSPGRMPRAIAEYVSCDLTSYHLMMFLLHRVALKLLMLH